MPPDNSAFLPFPTETAAPLGNAHFGMNEDFIPTPLHSFNPEGFEISTEMLEAFSTLEPIDATVGSLHDFQ